ncbi:kunitz trypsin inhibitor 2-like [Chenopodium quinoa]|uniref:kunitz trypsin inhibitor 2-like n=1 Tax=Chenopodium quinoa TaxID=63459 RepID=UPI000B7949A5|nr:kunitz trypsin inhibitor 2-like [Chenopodium quinoa]
MANKYNSPILSSFLLLLLTLTLTTVIAQDDHDHGTVPPPPPPPAAHDDHDHDHDHGPTPPPPPPAAPVTIVNIFDTDAKPVVSGQKYYILPVVQRRGGGIGTRPKNAYEDCPLNVVQETDTKALGIPITFKPIKSGSTNITFSTDMNIAFTSSNGCNQSPIWTLKPGNQKNKTQYVILGGSINLRGPNTIKSWFKIERFFPRFHFDYKLVYCPSANDLPGYKEAICGDLGVYVQEDGTWLLGVGAPPLRVKFKKA